MPLILVVCVHGFTSTLLYIYYRNAFCKVSTLEQFPHDYFCFEAYQAEVQAIAQLGISFHDWLKLAPSEEKPNGAELMYIIPSKSLKL